MTPERKALQAIAAATLCLGIAACSHRPIPAQPATGAARHGETLRQGLEAQTLPRGAADGLRPTARELRGIGGEVRGLGGETTGAQEALTPPVSGSGNSSGGNTSGGTGR